ncbi:MAG: hypothetical protein ABSG25_03595 [Bryobacteraceae bacterium]
MWLIMLLFGPKRIGRLFFFALIFTLGMSVLTIIGAFLGGSDTTPQTRYFYDPCTASLAVDTEPAGHLPHYRPCSQVNAKAARLEPPRDGSHAAVAGLQRDAQHWAEAVEGFILRIVSILFFVVLIGATWMILRNPGHRKAAPGGPAADFISRGDERHGKGDLNGAIQDYKEALRLMQNGATR